MKPLDYSALHTRLNLKMFLWPLSLYIPTVIAACSNGDIGLLFFGYTSIAYALIVAWLISWQRSKRIENFALANNLQPNPYYFYGQAPPALQGMGHSEDNDYIYDIPLRDSWATIFQHKYTVGNDKYQHTFTFTIMVLTNLKKYPHLFLDGQQNGASYAYAAAQRISLEGNFDKSFKLYAPEGLNIDALSILAPDVMQTLVDGGRPYDIEIVGDKMYIIAKGNQYTEPALKAMRQFGQDLLDEFDHKSVSWRPNDLQDATPLRENWFRGFVSGESRPASLTYLGLAIFIVILFFAVIEPAILSSMSN
ncbi:MAG: hypothetical protein JWN38_1225 [Candidatus Saccharibacteria bacterium]|nr:hypothetical protein [Candidatus Saccharibacteria bacterium]